MTVTPKIHVNDGNLVAHGKTILTGVPDNIVLTPGSGVGLVAGAFIGATASASKSFHVFPIGTLEYAAASLFYIPHVPTPALCSWRLPHDFSLPVVAGGCGSCAASGLSCGG